MPRRWRKSRPHRRARSWLPSYASTASWPRRTWGVQLTALKDIESPYAQGKFVADGGWAIIVPASSPTDYRTRTDDSKAAGLCAEELAKREIPATGKAAQITGEPAVAQ